MTNSSHRQSITDFDKIKQYLLSMRPGDEVFVNGQDAPLTLTHRQTDPQGRVHFKFDAAGTIYETVINPVENESINLSTQGTNNDFVVLNIEHPNGQQFILSDTRAKDYLNRVH